MAVLKRKWMGKAERGGKKRERFGSHYGNH
jgi:hypothetical protein